MNEVRKTLSQISSEQREMRKEFQDRLYGLAEIKITEIKERLENISCDLHKIIYKLKKINIKIMHYDKTKEIENSDNKYKTDSNSNHNSDDVAK
ncbi:hypothetical protein [Thermogemmata fonticola]|jgi:hypothetical protein|uniref:Uncharacterized protein n=1 Tax=Thermogemmata fonticola TaxID=2755323 RepID=A0A7V8VF02_9BACT|nr:hypothetical protein [Thermogemmata fonticola]MBA2226751.1 hypothetical protein [Thermogemmata fonticola]